MRKYVDSLLGLYLALACLGLFIKPGLTASLTSLLALYLWIAGYLFLLFSISYEFVFIEREASFPPLPFRFIILGIIFMNFLLQLTGGAHSTLWTSYYLFTVVFAALSRPLQAIVMALVIITIEGLSLTITGQFDPARWQVYAGFVLSLAGVSAATSFLMGKVLKVAEQAKVAHDRLIEKADAHDPLADPAKLELLTQDSRQTANLRTARDREKSLSALLDMAFQFVPAHAYALFVNEGRENRNTFVLRAVRAVRGRDLLPVGTTLDPASGKTHVDLCAETRLARYLSDIAGTSGPALGYYPPDALPDTVRSVFLVPIVSKDAERVVAVLAADMATPDGFDRTMQETLKGFSAFFLEIIEKTQMALELQSKAAHFGALHDISTDLNRSLKFAEIMERIVPRMKTVLSFDYCVCLLREPAATALTVRVIALDGCDPGIIGKTFPVEASTVLAFMHRHWRDQQTTTFYTADYGDRIKDIELFPLKELQRPVRSLFGRLFTADDDFLGAFFLGSSEPEAFTNYHRDYLLDTLMNQVALVANNSRLHQQIENMARTDGLTGLLNHRTFMELLIAKYRELERTPRPFSILLMDIDRFKSVNDTYGHPVGDIAIKAVARILHDTVRGTDFVARYGGEEFAIGMVETDRTGAALMAERIREKMEHAVVTQVADGALRCTLSIGVATFPDDTTERSGLVAMADEALYHAKRTGRNRVCLYRDIAKDTA